LSDRDDIKIGPNGGRQKLPLTQRSLRHIFNVANPSTAAYEYDSN